MEEYIEELLTQHESTQDWVASLASDLEDAEEM